ncbi:type II toxin-antitoxin system RelE/ParE family toxin [Foetidibacter luteolus]|uniref:type II toxin-antitoxin system RelE/ParE family toxin n=1 Tax=Foetidibacter luteolus TaxID=2608880 RepID=UPI00129AC1B4|nr:type II toxin-antitoxin system RelE/ParE family toxin [Foetidibacter luteolus]
MVVIFIDPELEYIFTHGKERRKPVYNEGIVRAFIKKVSILRSVTNSAQLKLFGSLHFEALKGDYKGFHSIRVNDQYRIVFKILKQIDGSQIIEIAEIHELTDYH